MGGEATCHAELAFASFRQSGSSNQFAALSPGIPAATIRARTTAEALQDTVRVKTFAVPRGIDRCPFTTLTVRSEVGFSLLAAKAQEPGRLARQLGLRHRAHLWR